MKLNLGERQWGEVSEVPCEKGFLSGMSWSIYEVDGWHKQTNYVTDKPRKRLYKYWKAVPERKPLLAGHFWGNTRKYT